MDEAEKQFWLQRFDSLKVEWTDITEKLIRLAEKLGRVGEGTKKELGKISAKLEIPWYKNSETILRIAILLALLIIGIIVAVKGGCLWIKDFVEVGTCTPING